jgi:hypothetical protein
MNTLRESSQRLLQEERFALTASRKDGDEEGARELSHGFTNITHPPCEESQFLDDRPTGVSFGLSRVLRLENSGSHVASLL